LRIGGTAGRQQESDRPRMIAESRRLHRHVCRLGSGVQQQLDNGRVPASRRERQNRVRAAIRLVGIASGREQSPHDDHIAVFDGSGQRAVPHNHVQVSIRDVSLVPRAPCRIRRFHTRGRLPHARLDAMIRPQAGWRDGGGWRGGVARRARPRDSAFDAKRPWNYKSVRFAGSAAPAPLRMTTLTIRTP